MANWPTDYDELTAPADGDKILVNDVSETTVGKKIKWWTNTGLKAFLKTYFDTLYLALVAPGTSGNVLTSNGSAWTSAASAGGGGDWTTATGTWSYSSADAPTFVFSVNNDQTAIIYVGQRLSIIQDGVEKFFIVTAKGAYSGGNTLITGYGGTDYTLTANPITSPKWSNVKVPSRFPMSPIKWEVLKTYSSSATQATPTNGTWYNVGTTNHQISLPIGLWKVSYKAIVGVDRDTTGSVDTYCTLSSANNSQSDADLTCQLSSTAQAAAYFAYVASFFCEKVLSIAAKATYYLNLKVAATDIDNIYIFGDRGTTIIKAVCAYL